MERLLEYFKPENYRLQLNINKHTGKVFGKVEITGRPLKDEIRLHAKNLNITEVSVDGKSVLFDQQGDVLSIFRGAGQSLSSDTPRRAASGRSDGSPVTTGRAERSEESALRCHLEIRYTFTLNTNMQGCYLSSYDYNGEKELLVSTQFESHYARECFPCVDEPEAKATFDLKIITPDADDTVISNMPIKSEVVWQSSEGHETWASAPERSEEDLLDNSRDQKIVEFETTPKMSTYLLAFCLGRFHKKSKTSLHSVKVTTYCALNQSPKTLDHANEIAADALDYYDDHFGIAYPLPKLDQVAIPDFEAGAMENWGLVTYREACLLADKSEAKSTREYIATVIAHELSHQWFGNLVTMKWWNNLWLNESFANLMEYVCVDAIRPDYHIWEYFYTGECRIAMLRDALPGVQAVQQDVSDPAEISTLFDGAIVYAKGAHLMFMLMRLMGERSFFAGLKEYFKKHQYSNTTGNDLWAALQKHAKFDVKEFMDAWISQPGYPVITDEVQQRFLLSGATDDTEWPLPKITDDMSGHYIINLSSEEFAEKLGKFDRLSEEQKIRLLIDRSLLAKTALVSSATHLDLLPKFKDETAFAVWSPVSGLISDLKLFFQPDDKDYKTFQHYVFSLVEPNLSRLGFLPKKREDDNDTKLRNIVLGYALYAEDQKTMEKLAKYYDQNLEKILPEIRSEVLTAKIRLDESIFDEFLAKYQSTADPNIKDDLLSALTDAKNHAPRLIKLLDQHDIVRPQDHLYLFVDLLRNHKTREKAIDWLYDNWNDVVEMTGEKSVEDYPRLLASSVRTIEEAKRFEEFFTPLAENPVLTRTITVAKADIDARLKLLMLDSAAVHEHLDKID